MSEEPRNGDLQFESVTPPPLPSAEGTSPGMTCAACSRPITVDYFDLNDRTVCRVCRVAVLEQAEAPMGMGLLMRAGAFGLAAALAGAALYYAVIAITEYEIGLVAIAIGYMVGYAVLAGAKGRGARRFQVLAVVLTYVSVSLAYLALALGSASADAESGPRADAITNQARSAGSGQDPESDQEASAADGSSTSSDDEGNALVGLAFLAVFSLALPVLSVAGSMPSGLISAAIIAFGMQQAWRMTTAPEIRLTGPFKVGLGGDSAPA
jgi:hypothetical protein